MQRRLQGYCPDLWENGEALEKYLKRLKELMEEDTMKEKIIEYGTTHEVEVDSATQKAILVIAPEIKEGFVLMGHGMQKLPKNGDKGKIVFERGGPKNGYWKFYPNKNEDEN